MRHHKKSSWDTSGRRRAYCWVGGIVILAVGVILTACLWRRRVPRELHTTPWVTTEDGTFSLRLIGETASLTSDPLTVFVQVRNNSGQYHLQPVTETEGELEISGPDGPISYKPIRRRSSAVLGDRYYRDTYSRPLMAPGETVTVQARVPLERSDDLKTPGEYTIVLRCRSDQCRPPSDDLHENFRLIVLTTRTAPLTVTRYDPRKATLVGEVSLPAVSRRLGEHDYKADARMLRRTEEVAVMGETRHVSTDAAIDAAERLFTEIDFVGMSWREAVDVLGGSFEVKDTGVSNHDVAFNTPLVYRLKTVEGGVQYALLFKHGLVSDVEVLELD
jgi:hypothetical protein